MEERPPGHLICPVCRKDGGHRRFKAREMMFGSREQFDYAECAGCGCLWLLDPPADMSRYYGGTYYSFRRSGLERWVRRHPSALRLAHLLTSRRLPALPEWWPDRPPRLDASVLDIGSGAGNLLFRLKALGFTRLLGIDPYLEAEVSVPGGPALMRRSIDSIDGSFDVVILNHSFEHMPNPNHVFRRLGELIAAGGRIVIRTPVASTYAHRTYGADWVQLDAPRHLVVHTKKSISILAARVGLVVESVIFDSTGLQCWGSELYRRDIPLVSSRKAARIFTASQMREFEARARKLNELGDGDQAAFVLARSAG